MDPVPKRRRLAGSSSEVDLPIVPNQLNPDPNVLNLASYPYRIKLVRSSCDPVSPLSVYEPFVYLSGPKDRVPPMKCQITHIFPDLQGMEVGEKRFSPIMKHFGCEIKIQITRQQDNFQFQPYVSVPIIWDIEVHQSHKMISRTGKEIVSKNLLIYEHGSPVMGSPGILKRDNNPDFFGPNNNESVISEVEMEVYSKRLKEMRWPHVQHHNRGPGDRVLKVMRQNYRVNRKSLTDVSPYFQRLFDGFDGFFLRVIPLRGVRPHEFRDFLDFLQKGEEALNEGNIEDILRLSEKFEIQKNFAICENWMRNGEKSKMVSKKFKLRMAIKYGFDDLKTQIINGLNSPIEIRSVMGPHQTPPVSKLLQHRLMDLQE